MIRQNHKLEEKYWRMLYNARMVAWNVEVYDGGWVVSGGWVCSLFSGASEAVSGVA